MNRKLYREIKKSLITALRVEPSEFFVNRVRAEVEARSAPARRTAPVRRLRVPGWLSPELGLAAAALLIFLLGTVQRTPVSADALLLGRLPQEDRWVGMTEDV